PENKVTLLQWAADNANENKMMFTSPLVLDAEALENYEPPQPMMGLEAQGAPQEPKAPRPFADAVADGGRRMRKLDVDELRDLVEVMGQEPEGLERFSQIIDFPSNNAATSATSATNDGDAMKPKRDRAA